MNVATAGKRARARGGKGFDKVRANPEDLPSIRGVERVHRVVRVKG